MCFDGDAATVWNEQRVRARKPYVCYECDLTIPAGRDYIRIGCLSDGNWDTFRLHVECNSLWDFIHIQVCEGEGLKLAGGLGEEIAHQDDTDGKDPDDEYDIRDWDLSTKETLDWLWDCARAPYAEAAG